MNDWLIDWSIDWLRQCTVFFTSLLRFPEKNDILIKEIRSWRKRKIILRLTWVYSSVAEVFTAFGRVIKYLSNLRKSGRIFTNAANDKINIILPNAHPYLFKSVLSSLKSCAAIDFCAFKTIPVYLVLQKIY